MTVSRLWHWNEVKGVWVWEDDDLLRQEQAVPDHHSVERSRICDDAGGGGASAVLFCGEIHKY